MNFDVLRASQVLEKIEQIENYIPIDLDTDLYGVYSQWENRWNKLKCWLGGKAEYGK